MASPIAQIPVTKKIATPTSVQKPFSSVPNPINVCLNLCDVMAIRIAWAVKTSWVVPEKNVPRDFIAKFPKNASVLPEYATELLIVKLTKLIVDAAKMTSNARWAEDAFLLTEFATEFTIALTNRTSGVASQLSLMAPLKPGN